MNNSFAISDEQKNYAQCNLQANPFPYSPVPAEDPEIFCGQQHVAEQISSTVSSVLATGKSKHLVVTGKYGNGKSHTLKYTRSLLRDREDVVVGYVAQPGEGFLDIYHEFMYDLGFNRIQELAYNWLASIACDVTDTNPTGAEPMRSLIDEGDVLLSDIVPEAIRKLSDITHFADFARAIVHMVYKNTNLYAWQWLTAEGIRYEQRKEMEIHSALDDDTMGVRAFTALKNLLLRLGYTSVFAFVDEFESIARLNSKNEQTTLNSIRHLIDQNSSGLCMLFGCAPEVWQGVMGEYHAFSERIGQEVALRPLTSEHLYELVADYLNRERDEQNIGTPIQPFTEESLDMILQRSQGNVRQVLALCSRVLDTAVEDEREVITEEFVQERMQL
jgi:type II secretory pathway predicted ATPase ExeA